MITKEYIVNRLKTLGFNPDILQLYDEPHRYWHTITHVIDILEWFNNEKLQDNTFLIEDNSLFLAAVFHDCFYKPYSFRCNEVESNDIFIKEAKNTFISKRIIDEVSQIILDTQEHIGNSDKSKVFQYIDMDIVYSRNIDELIDWEDKIFKEFQCYDYKKYLKGRLSFLNNFDDRKSIQKLITYIQYKKPKIAVYAGSFSPLHKGHYNILQKAEQIFDKVIIARGKNPDKANNKVYDLPEIIKNRQIEEYEGLLTDFLNKFDYDVTLIRGLRNATDLQYETTQYRFLKDLKPDIKVVNILCDPEFEHISSSSIRMLEKYGKGNDYLLK